MTTNRLNFNRVCTVCLTDLPPLDDAADPVQRAAAPILHRREDGWDHRLCSIQCARALLSSNRPTCPVNGCDAHLTPQSPGMDERIKALIEQTIIPEEVIDISTEEGLRLWLLNQIDTLIEEYPEQTQWIANDPEDWVENRDAFVLAKQIARECDKGREFLTAVESWISRRHSLPQHILIHSLYLAIFTGDREKMRRFLFLGAYYQTPLELDDFAKLLLSAIEKDFNLAQLYFSRIPPRSRMSVIGKAMDLIALYSPNRDSRMRHAQTLLAIASQVDSPSEELFGLFGWRKLSLAKLLFNYSLDHQIPLSDDRLLQLFLMSTREDDLEFANQICASLQEEQKERILFDAYLIECHFAESDPSDRVFADVVDSNKIVGKILQRLKDTGVLQKKADLLLLNISERAPSALAALYQACREDRIEISEGILEMIFHKMIGKDPEFCQKILSFSADPQSIVSNTLRYRRLKEEKLRALLAILDDSLLQQIFDNPPGNLPSSSFQIFLDHAQTREFSLSPKFFSFALSCALCSKDLETARRVVVYDESLKEELLCSSAENYCVEWSWNKSKRDELFLQLQNLLELSHRCNSLARVKELIQERACPELFESLSDLPEWWASDLAPQQSSLRSFCLIQ